MADTKETESVAQEEEAPGKEEEPAEGGEEADEGNDNTKDDAGGAASGEKVEAVFASFLTRCQEDIDSRREKKIELFDKSKQEMMQECTFQPQITDSGQKSNGQKIGHSLYYRGLLATKERLERQKKRLEEVIEEERKCCPFKPNTEPSSLGNNTQYAEFITPPPIRTPRMSAVNPSPRKEPLRLDLSEELNQNARDARDLYRQDPRKQKTKTGYVEASIDKIHSLGTQLTQAIDTQESGAEM